MGSRRTTTLSSFGNGRSSNGNDVTGSSRPSSCSYLSNVRPENRSTLCSMMAQLTEEKQPSFETTLKSKAVSENCNVKFSCVVTGHPVPQVIWYKDDVQLDRYCGLPKYEIFRNGQNHSLHIYNCTVEDAAMYQASATNSKGIVSCSGVLEVGEMNEFKIHQRYFAKLKQKADNRRREVEGKENQEPLRTISPDRTQRKRRSTSEAFLSTPSSMEDEGNEESRQTVAVETEAMLQGATVKEEEQKRVPITNGAVSAVTNGQTFSENSKKCGTYVYDSTQKTFTALQPKAPFVKKKIKISNSAKVAKSDIPGECRSEERKAKDEASTSVALTCTETTQSKGNSEEVMEVENSFSSAVVGSDSRNMTEQHQESQRVEAFYVERLSKDKNVCAEVTAPSQKEQLTALVPATTLLSTSHTVSGTEGKQAAKYEKEAGHKDKEKKLEIQNQSPHISSTQQQTHSAAASHGTKAKEDIPQTEDVAVMDVDGKSTPSAPCLALRGSVNAPRESSSALPQRPCEQAGDQLSEKETSPGQKNVSVSLPAPLSEVTQAGAKKNRNDAPVSLELSLNQRTMEVQPPQKSPSNRDTSTADTQTSSLRCGLRAAIDKTTQDTFDHSRGSNESHTVLFTDIQKSPLQSPGGGGENTQGCNVSSSAQERQVDTAIKTVEGTKIQVSEKVEGNEVGKLLLQSDTVASNEKVVEMETESAVEHKIEHTETEKTKDVTAKDTDVFMVNASNKESEKYEHILNTMRESSSESHNLKSNTSETATPLLTETLENTNLSQLQIYDFKEIQKPVTKVISVAELLRAQLKTLDQDPTTTSSISCEKLKDDDSKCKQEVKKSMPDRKPVKSTDDAPPRNIKETLMEIYHQLHETDQEQIQTQGTPSSHIQTQGTPSSHIQTLQNPPLIPPISAVDSGSSIETTALQGSAKKYNEGVADICQETRARALVSNLSGTVSQERGTPFTVTPIKVSQESNTNVLEHAKDQPAQDKHIEFVQKSNPETEINSKTERGVPATPLNQYQMGEQNPRINSLQSAQKFPTKTVLDKATQENNHQFNQQDSSVEYSRTNSLASSAPEASPLSKQRNCVSPIPSATAQELASGARRKILTSKAKPEEALEATLLVDNKTQKKEASTESSKLYASPATLSTSPSLSRQSPLLQPPGEQISPGERRSPLLSRRKMTAETQTPSQQPTEKIQTPKTEEKPPEKDKHDPFKAPQVIRKIRGETFADASGHLKLWCQFFNVLSDSTVKWYRNDEEIAQIKRNAGDETQVKLAIVQASCKDSGVYRCTITNEYGTDSTDCLLSADILAGMSLLEDLGVGEEIEMTPLIFTKGVADSGVWGNKFFGRIMMQESHIGDGCSHKVWRAKVIYGLEPVFESGNTCIIKAPNPIAYGGKGESSLIDRNLDIVRQECKIQNLAREYCKIFSAEARVIENFGPCLEVIPVYLMYRPANTVPYVTAEADLTGVYKKYSFLDHAGRIDIRTGSEVEQKCCALQHWIFQWTNGNLLLTRLEGVDTKITNVGISVKSTGHQGLPVEGNPKVFEQFASQHQCNYFCGLLSLRSLKVMDSLLTPTKPKSSRSPLLQRKMAGGSSSPQTSRKAAGSPRLSRKTEQEGRKTPTKQRAADVP